MSRLSPDEARERVEKIDEQLESLGELLHYYTEVNGLYTSALNDLREIMEHEVTGDTERIRLGVAGDIIAQIDGDREGRDRVAFVTEQMAHLENERALLRETNDLGDMEASE